MSDREQDLKSAIVQLILKWACLHKFKVFMSSIRCDSESNNLITDSIILECEKCGKIKVIKS